MKKVVAAIIVAGGLFVIVMNTEWLGNKASEWASLNPKDPRAPQVLYWTGWWADKLNDGPTAEKLFWQLYQNYPGENAMVAEGLYRIAAAREQSSARLTCLDYCKLVMEKYPSEEKWRFQAAQLYDQVINNAH